MRAFLIYSSLFIALSLQAQDIKELRPEPPEEPYPECTAIDNFANDLYKKPSKDSSILFTKLAADCFKESEAWEKYVGSLAMVSAMYESHGTFEDFSTSVNKAYQEAQQYLNPRNRIYGFVSNNMGAYFAKKADWDTAISFYKKSLENKEIDPIGKAKFYQNIANAYEGKGDYEQALSYVRRAVNVFKDSMMLNNHARSLGDMALIHRNSLNTEEAVDLYEESLAMDLDLNGPDSIFNIETRINTFQNLAEIYLEKRDFSKSFTYTQRALGLQQKETPYRKASSFKLLAKLFLEKGEYNKALQYSKQALALQKKQMPQFENHPAIANKLMIVGDVYAAKKQYKKALDWYQEALFSISLDFEDKSPLQNPKKEDILVPFESLDLLKKKSDYLLALYQNTKEIDWLEGAYQSLLLATDLLQEVRQDYDNERSKYLFAQKAHDIYENALKTASAYYTQTGKTLYLEKAFDFMEQNKAIVLLESLQERTAKSTAGIPDSLLQAERILLGKAFYYKNRILASSSSPIQLKKWQESLFEIEEKLKKQEKAFELSFPKYHALKYQTDNIDLSTVQATLRPHEMILEYFVGDSSIFLFKIKKETITLHEITQKSVIDQSIDQLLTSIRTSPLSSSAIKNYRSYTQSAHYLYQELLAVALGDNEDISNLIVISDDRLNYIPFEVLLQKQAPEKVNYSSKYLDYLIKDYSINYNYSSTLWDRLRRKEQQDYEYYFYGFAPSFDPPYPIVSERSCGQTELYGLKCNKRELESIQSAIGGAGVAGPGADKDHFLSVAHKANILHFATHACTDEADPMQSKIFLSNSDLSNLDLYELELHANLAVLSACNTGTGQLVKGEGVMSLSRGFFNAGVNSVLLSLWSVDDCTTSDLMLSFYKKTNKGTPINTALRQTKLEHLTNAEKLYKHPYYWAAFIQSGKVAPLENSSAPLKKWLLPILALILLLSFVFLSKRSKKD